MSVNNGKLSKGNLPTGKRYRGAIALTALGIIGIALATCAPSGLRGEIDSSESLNAIRSGLHGAVATPAFAQALQSPHSIADIAEKVVPSVVNVTVEKLARPASNSMQMDPFFRDFFGRQAPQGPQRQKGAGSGVIISSDGLIVTNNHVIEGAERLTVTLSDGREFEAEVVGADPRSDVAVAKLKNASGLTPIAMGSSEKMRLGEVVLAIGNPFGVGQTITMGIISAKGRSRVGIADFEDFIQTDAAINPGNSGGALVNMNGELIGVNTAILSRSGGYQGIGLAIPTDMVAPIVRSLRKDGVVKRGWLGVAIQDLHGDLARAMNVPAGSGVLISEVSTNTPASNAGLQSGDIVTHLDGKRVRNQGALRNRIAAAGANRKIVVRYLRSGAVKETAVVLGLRPDNPTISSAPRKSSTKSEQSVLGLELQELSDANRSQYSIDRAVGKGAVIVGVNPNGPGSQVDLRPGDVIVQANGKRIGSVRGVVSALRQQSAGKPTLLVVNRQGATLFVAISK